MDAERILTKARIAVQRSTLPGLRLYAGVMAVGRVMVVDNIPTACTNGVDEMYGRAFLEGFGPQRIKEVSFVCVHETLHKALRHTTVGRAMYKLDPKLANMACDYVVNQIILDADPNGEVCVMPKGPDGKPMGLFDPKYRGWSSMEVFRDLQQNGGGGGDNFDEHDWESGNELSEDERRKIDRDIDVTLRQGAEEARKMGLGKGDMPVDIKEILEPKVDWRKALAEFVTETCKGDDDATYRRLNRRFMPMEVYMPTRTTERIGDIVIGADLSGSMWYGDPAPTQIILSEMHHLANIVKPTGVHVLYWDTRITRAEYHKGEDLSELLSTTKPTGGGGTDPQCVPDYLREHKIKPQCVIMLTDGEVPNWGAGWEVPVLWVVIGNPGLSPPNGRVLHISDLS